MRIKRKKTKTIANLKKKKMVLFVFLIYDNVHVYIVIVQYIWKLLKCFLLV